MIWKLIRYEAKRFVARPGFTAIGVITLALTIGCNTSIFTLVDTLFLQYLPVPHADKLMGVYGRTAKDRLSDMAFPIDDYQYYKEHNDVFTTLAAHYSTAPLYMVTGSGQSELIQAAVVSSDYFPLLELRPALGRFFLPDEDPISSQHPVAVIGYQMWQSRFRGDPNIVGQSIKLNSATFTIVGVAPQHFTGVVPSFPDDVWIPLSMSSVGYRWCKAEDRSCAFLGLIGRLKPDKNDEQSQAEFSALSQQITNAYPDTRKHYVSLMVAPVRGLRPTSRPEFVTLLRLLISAGLVMLLIGSANLSGLLLTQGVYRNKEMAIRLSLGATRGRIISQLLSGGFSLSVVGGICGLALAWFSSGALSKLLLIGEDGKPTIQFAISSHVLLFNLIVSIAMIFLFALTPALINSRPNLSLVMKDQESLGGFHKSALRRVLVTGQIALSIGLLICAMLLIKSVNSIIEGPGFDTTHIACFRVSPLRVGYDAVKSATLQREVIHRLQALPGVESVAIGRQLPWREGSQVGVALPEQAAMQDGQKTPSYYQLIGPGYLNTLGIPILEGRDFNEGDRQGTPYTAIVNNVLAQQLWPRTDPIGRTVKIDSDSFTVIGVTKDPQYKTSQSGPQAFFYASFWQNADASDARIFVRTKLDGASILPAIHRAIAGIDSDLPISEEMTMEEGTKRDFGSLLLARNILLSVAGIALFLSVTGLYGVISFGVSQRTREIGIRTALGASRLGIMKLIMSEGMFLAVLGVALGLAGSTMVTKLLGSFLYGVLPLDLVIYSSVSVSLIIASLIAVYFPARRAMRVDPMAAMRYE